MPKNAENRNLKKWRHQQIRFWGDTDTFLGRYVCQKSIYQPEIWHARCQATVLQHITRLFFLKIKKKIL